MVWFCLSGAIISADLHMAQLMPLPLTVSCFSKIQIGFTFLVPAHPGSPGKRAVKRVYLCVCVSVRLSSVPLIDSSSSMRCVFCWVSSWQEVLIDSCWSHAKAARTLRSKGTPARLSTANVRSGSVMLTANGRGSTQTCINSTTATTDYCKKT